MEHFAFAQNRMDGQLIQFPQLVYLATKPASIHALVSFPFPASTHKRRLSGRAYAQNAAQMDNKMEG